MPNRSIENIYQMSQIELLHEIYLSIARIEARLEAEDSGGFVNSATSAEKSLRLPPPGKQESWKDRIKRMW